MIIDQRSIFIFLSFIFLCFSCQPKEKPISDIAKNIQKLTKSIEQAPDQSTPYADRAAYYRSQQGYDEAIADYLKAIDLSPETPTYYIDLADTYIDYGDAISARITLDKSIIALPDHVDLRLKLTQLLIILNEHNQAVPHLQRAKVLDPFNAEVEYMRGILFLDQEKPESAIKAFQATVELDDQHIKGWIALGEIASAKNDSAALTYYDNALGIQPTSIRTLHAKAYYLQNSDQIDQAITIYEQITEIDSTYELAYFNRALLNLDRGNAEVAEQLLKAALEQKPNLSSAYYYLGIIQEKEGDLVGALSYYRQVVEIDPDNQQAVQAVDELTEALAQ